MRSVALCVCILLPLAQGGFRGAGARPRAGPRAVVRLSTLEHAAPAAPAVDGAGATAAADLPRATPAPRASARASMPDMGTFVLRAGPPSFFWPTPPAAGSTKPVLVYLPGIEMTGYTISTQLERLAPHYDVRIFRVSPEDRTPGAKLHHYVDIELQALAEQGRTVVLMGESFGGVIALDVLLRMTRAGTAGRIGHLVLMNPATCMPATPWPSLAPWVESLSPQAFAAMPVAISPLLSNPLRLIDFRAPPAGGAAPRDGAQSARGGVSAAVLEAALNLTDPLPFPELTRAVEAATGRLLAMAGRAAGPQVEPGADGWAEPDIVLERLVGLLPTLTQLPVALPQATLAFRLRELDALARDVNARDWSSARTPTLVIASSGDLLIPSAAAARQIQARLIGTRVRTLDGAGHAPLLETNVDLLDIFATALVLEQPTPAPRDFVRAPLADAAEQRAASETLRPLRRLTSPRFFSTTPSGVRVPGLSAVPDVADAQGRARPVLFVGNHQLVGVLDIPLVVEELLTRRGIFARALAHPLAFGTPTGAPGDEMSEQQLAAANSRLGESALAGVDARGRASLSKLPMPMPPQRGEAAARGGMFGGAIDISHFGAVPVSGRNLFRLLQRNEAVLLYPGGVREAFKPREGLYQLSWPEGEGEADFMRLAAKTNAIVVPVAAVGADDVVHLANADELLALPWVGDSLRAFANSVPQGRPGELFVPPITFQPLPLPRAYFCFGRPLDASKIDAKDVAATSGAYAAVKRELELNLRWLLERRDSDPYRGFAKRIAYEAASNWERQAPTFRI